MFTLNYKEPTSRGRHEFSEKAVAPDWDTNNSPVLTVPSTLNYKEPTSRGRHEFKWNTRS